HPVLSRSARFADLAKAGGQFRPTEPSDLMAIPDETVRAAHIEDYVRQEISRILRSDPANADAYETLEDAGLDSLSSLVLRARLETAFGITIPTSRYATVSTIPALAGLVCALTGETDGSPQQTEPESGDEREADETPENRQALH
ncbi:MAG: acyl carrier protein, partial [Pseudomonadota bacterium]